jgi:hypothetical protein
MPRIEFVTKVPERDPELAPARSVRRATARRASNRRATAPNTPQAPPVISPRA